MDSALKSCSPLVAKAKMPITEAHIIVCAEDGVRPSDSSVNAYSIMCIKKVNAEFFELGFSHFPRTRDDHSRCALH